MRTWNEINEFKNKVRELIHNRKFAPDQEEKLIYDYKWYKEKLHITFDGRNTFVLIAFFLHQFGFKFKLETVEGNPRARLYKLIVIIPYENMNDDMMILLVRLVDLLLGEGNLD